MTPHAEESPWHAPSDAPPLLLLSMMSISPATPPIAARLQSSVTVSK